MAKARACFRIGGTRNFGYILSVMRILAWSLAVFCILGSVAAQQVPVQLRGKWIVKRVIPTPTAGCLGPGESEQLIGTEIEYSANSMRWKDKVIAHPTVSSASLTAEQFHRQNAGQASEQVTYLMLGIQSATATEVSLVGPDENIPRDRVGVVPGDNVLIKDRNTIVFDFCNVFFEAARAPNGGGPPQ